MKEFYNEATGQLSVQPEAAGERLLSWLSMGKHLPINHRLVVYGEEAIGAFFRKFLMNGQKVKKNRIFFATYQKSYACNCKYIAQAILEEGLDYELIFMVSKDVYENRDAYEVPHEIKLVRRDSLEAFYALATSAVWFDNSLNCIWRRVPKKKSQTYFNTWHGSLGIKRLDGSFHWKVIAEYGNKTIDYFITDSTFDEQVFSGSFWPKADFFKVGHPRNDILYNQEKMEKARTKVYNRYGIAASGEEVAIPGGVRTALYAPTFRDNKNDVSALAMDFERVKRALEEKFGGQWLILSRLHYHNYINENATSKFKGQSQEVVIDVSDYPDMQELMAAADVGITDYSSWIFDYLATGRPGFVYAEDIEKYINDRGFYYPLSETPFSIASSSQLLVENIRSFDSADYEVRVQEFLQGKGFYGKGQACKGVIEWLEKRG